LTEKSRSSWWHEEASRRFANGAGESLRDIASALKSMAPKGGKAPSKSTLDRFLSPKPPPAPESGPSASPPTSPALPAEVLDPDRTPYSSEDLIRDTAASLRQQRALFRALMEQGEHARAQQAAKLVGYYTGVLQKLQKADEEEGETIKVTLESMAAAADRALKGLVSAADRVIAELETWPKCPTCARPHGEFASTDKSSPIRALFERVAAGRI
jgi:predicted DNA-binding antitoxin AbrB/MazE fold protein